MARRSANRRGPSQARKPDRGGPTKPEAPPAPPAAPNPDLEVSQAAIGAPLSEHEQARRAAVLAMPKPMPDDGLTQSERFIKAAQELGTDDDPERFAERVRKLAKAPVSEGKPGKPPKPSS